MTKIKSIKAREILDSRGNPTIEADIILDNNQMARASVPSGASTGEFEAVELRDNDKKRYLGKGVRTAVENINSKIAKALNGFEVNQQSKIDQLMIDLDGTENKSNLGANAILAVSLAYARLSALVNGQFLHQYISQLMGKKGVTMPVPMMNIINGGAHADNNVDIQEFMIMPLGFEKFSEALRAGVEIFHSLKKVLQSKKLNTAVGDEGGFAPNLGSNRQALAVICQAIEEAGYQVGKQIGLALDVASSEFFKEGIYLMENESQKEKTAQDMVSFYQSLQKDYPIYSIEDGCSENDWQGWKTLTDNMAQKTQLVGDDLFVTNTQKLKKGIDSKTANSILIKVNQIGSLTETINAISMAEKAGYTSVISHRSGETEDTFISSLAVGSDAGQIKTGSLCRTDRICKYNELLRIEEVLGEKAEYKGKSVFKFL